MHLTFVDFCTSDYLLSHRDIIGVSVNPEGMPMPGAWIEAVSYALNVAPISCADIAAISDGDIKTAVMQGIPIKLAADLVAMAGKVEGYGTEEDYFAWFRVSF